MTFINFTPHDGGPNPYEPSDRIDVQYADLEFGFDMAADFHGKHMWEHSGGSPSHFIVRHRRADSPFHRGGAVVSGVRP